jgi:uncharacterized protein (TIGR00255 family)
MACSMTAFARQAGEGEWSRTVWEIRSINHRFLEISVKLPDELRGLEAAVRERISTAMQRGKVDCLLRHNVMSAVSPALSINMPLARRIAQACRDLDDIIHTRAPLRALDLLHWPGVVETEAPDLDRVTEPLLKLLDSALDALVQARSREGEKLKALIMDRCVQAAQQSAILRERLPEIMNGLKERLRSRALELATGLEPGRLEQEMLLLALKLDVAEELDRLDTHIAEVVRILEEGGAIGRRLDFLMQEMNREANTIASKSAHVETTGVSVELKVLIEQMREQVQNLE